MDQKANIPHSEEEILDLGDPHVRVPKDEFTTKERLHMMWQHAQERIYLEGWEKLNYGREAHICDEDFKL